jgi:hypothetical protein
MAATKPTAATFFAQTTAANKTKIQAVLDAIAAGAARDKILSEVTGLGSQLNAVDREQLVNMTYQQLAAR